MRPSVTVGPDARCVDQVADRAVELVGGHGRVDRAPRRGLGTRELGSQQQQLARRTSPTRRGNSQVAPLSGVKPRS